VNKSDFKLLNTVKKFNPLRFQLIKILLIISLLLNVILLVTSSDEAKPIPVVINKQNSIEPYNTVIIEYDDYILFEQEDLIEAKVNCKNLEDLSTCVSAETNAYIDYFKSKKYKELIELGQSMQTLYASADPVYIHFHVSADHEMVRGNVGTHIRASDGSYNPLNIKEIDPHCLGCLNAYSISIFNIVLNIENPSELKTGWNTKTPCNADLNPSHWGVSGFYRIQHLGYERGMEIYRAKLVQVDSGKAVETLNSVWSELQDLPCM
jgi:hypothetical protein